MAESSGINKLNKDLSEANKVQAEGTKSIKDKLDEVTQELVDSNRGQEKAAALAEAHFRSVDTSVRGLVEDYKAHSKKMGLVADSNAINMAADLKQIVKHAQDGSRLSIEEASGKLQGFHDAIKTADAHEREFLTKAVERTEKAVGEIKKEMPGLMGEIVNETIKIPLDALDSFMESNYFTRILKNYFLAARARKKARLKEEKMRLEQIHAEKEAREEQERQIKSFYTNLTDEIMKSMNLGRDMTPEERAAVDARVKEETLNKFSQNEGQTRQVLGMEEAKTEEQKTAERIAAEFVPAVEAVVESPTGVTTVSKAPATLDNNVDFLGRGGDVKGLDMDIELEQHLESIQGAMVLNGYWLERIAIEGLGIASPGWLSKLPDLVEQGKERVNQGKEQVKSFKDGVKEQITSMKDGLKTKFDDIKGKVSGALGFGKKPKADVGAGEAEGVEEPEKASSGLSKFLESIKGGLAGIGKGVADALRGIFNAVAEGFKKLGDPAVLKGAAAIAIISIGLLAFAGAMFVFGKVDWGMALVGLIVFAAYIFTLVKVSKSLAKASKFILKGILILTLAMVPLLMFGAAMVMIGFGINLLADALTKLASIPVLGLLKAVFALYLLSALTPLITVLGAALLIASPGFMMFGLALAALGFGIRQFNSVGLKTILATMASLYVLAALAIPLAIASPFLLVASIGFGAFGIALMLLGIGIRQFMGVIPAILPMVAGLYALTILALPLALASPFLLIAAVGFGAFGVALMLLGIGIKQFLGVLWAIPLMVMSLYALTALAVPLALASPLLLIASIGFGAFGVALAVLAFGISQFMGIFFAIPVMVAGLYSIVALAIPLAIVSPLLLIASVAIGAFGVGLTLLALGISQFVGVLPAILPMVVALYAVAALAIPLGLMSPFLLLAAIGIAAFGFALIPLGIAMSMFSVDAAAGFAAAMGALIAFAVPLALLSLFGVFQLAASGLVAIAIGVLALAIATYFLASNYEVLASVLKHLIVLGLVGPLLVVAAVGIFLVAGALLAFSLAMVAVNAVMGLAAGVGLLGSLFGAENPLDMLFAIAAHADQLYLAGKGILFMAMGIGMLAKSLKNLDPEALAEIGESMQGILPGIVGGDMNFVAGNLVQGIPAAEMEGDNAEASSLQRTMAVAVPQQMMTIVGGGGGGQQQPSGGRQVNGTDGQEGGGRMNESTFRRVQERFYKSAIV